MGEGGRSLVEGLRLVNTLFVGEYDETEVVDAALEGMVSRLGDRWSYYLTAEELEAQNQRRTNSMWGLGLPSTTHGRRDSISSEWRPEALPRRLGWKPGRSSPL